VHVKEDKNAVPGFVGHKVDERLDSARFEIGFGVGVGVMADSVADAPNDVAEATEIENISPHAVIAVKTIVPAELRVTRAAVRSEGD
jgi:hypothetical protein